MKPGGGGGGWKGQMRKSTGLLASAPDLSVDLPEQREEEEAGGVGTALHLEEVTERDNLHSDEKKWRKKRSKLEAEGAKKRSKVETEGIEETVPIEREKGDRKNIAGHAKRRSEPPPREIDEAFSREAVDASGRSGLVRSVSRV